jgi:hypothetical protein
MRITWIRGVLMLVVLAGLCVAAADKPSETPKPPVISSRDVVLNGTSQWTGPRMDDGRPLVPDDILK